MIEEPYFLSFNEIVELTPRQLDYIYFRPRDKKTGAGKPLPYPFNNKHSKTSEKMAYINMGLSLGYTIEYLEAEWEKLYNGN